MVARTTQTVRQALVASFCSPAGSFLLACRSVRSRDPPGFPFPREPLAGYPSRPLPARAAAARMRKRHTPPWSTYLIGRPPLPVSAREREGRRVGKSSSLPSPLFTVRENSRKVAATSPPSPLRRLAMGSNRVERASIPSAWKGRCAQGCFRRYPLADMKEGTCLTKKKFQNKMTSTSNEF